MLNNTPLNNGKNQKLFILMGISGSGKSALAGEIVNQNKDEIIFPPSYTTRAPRESDKNSAKKYTHIDLADFKRKIQDGLFLEWELVHKKDLYGTLLSSLKEAIVSGKDILLEIDIKGCVSLLERKKNGDEIFKNIEIIPIFIFRKFPPYEKVDFNLLKDHVINTLQKREKIDKEILERRIESAAQEYWLAFVNRDRLNFLENKENNLLWTLDNFQKNYL